MHFNELPQGVQTALASANFQYGSLQSGTKDYWKQITEQRWQDASNNLKKFGDAYPSRRKLEAGLIDSVNYYSRIIIQMTFILDFMYQRRVAAVILCVSLTMTGGFAGHVQAQGLLLDPSLQTPSDLPAIVDRKVGITLHTCDDLIAALRAGKDLGESMEMPSFNSYADCLAITLIADAQHVSSADFDTTHVGERLYRNLDLASVASSLAPRRPAEHYRLQDFNFEKVLISPIQVVLQGNGFTYTFEVLSLGDFRNTGRPELLVRFSDRSNNGSYNKRIILIIDTTNGSQTLVSTDAIEVLRGAAESR